MANITLLHYNNYFNRTIKKLETVAEYHTADSETVSGQTVAHYLDIASVNFVPGDGVNTSLVLGTYTLEMGFDYLLVTHTDSSATPAVEVIDSRWFIMEEERTRDGQYQLKLRRDLIADYYQPVLNATTYIEKGFITPDNKLIFNSEGLAVNQIKQPEILLKDKSNCPWLVLYVARNATVSSGSVHVNYEPANKDYIDVSASTIDNWEYSQYRTTPFYGEISNPTYRINWQRGTGDNWHYGHYKTIVSSSGTASTSTISNDDWNYALRTSSGSVKPEDVNSRIQTQWRAIGANNMNNSLTQSLGCHSASAVNALRYYNGKIIKTQDGKYWRISVYSVSGLSYNETLITNLSLDIITQVQTVVRATGDFSSSHNTLNNRSLMVTCSAPGWQVSAVEVPDKEVTAAFSSNRNHTIDALYDIIAIPYGDLDIGYYSGEGTQTYTKITDTNKNIGMAVANSLAVNLTSANVYDVQLLPYCPLQSDLVGDGQIAIDYSSGEGTKYSWVLDNSTDPATKVGILFYVKESSFTFDIEKELNYLRTQRITGFKDVPIPASQSESPIKTDTNYVFQNLNTPQSVASDRLGFRIATLKDGRYSDELNITKINKVTGGVIATYKAYTIDGQYSDSDESTNNVKIYSATGGLIETLTRDAYNNGDFYLMFNINDDCSYGSLNIFETWPYVVKLPIISGTLSDSYSLKISNECDKYRLVSPNYQGEFEFSVAKNYGVNWFNVDCTYKPYNPYIHVNPNFKGLYGDDYNDGRGLICNGDFSFGMIGDKFAEYELQNKNYEAMFNRQIQNMDVNNAIARQEAKWQIGAGAVQGAASGALAGGMTTASPWGAVAGAVVGGVSSLAGGIMDYQNLGKRQDEAVSYAVDMYRYSLQNVQALPYSLTRCNAITANNKLFPFVEYYTCSEEEETAFVNKLMYDGMSVLAIGHISDYLDASGTTMIRGEIIRFEDKIGEAHVAREIYNEIKQGVYL